MSPAALLSTTTRSTTSRDQGPRISLCRYRRLDRTRPLPGPLHLRARESWDSLHTAGARLYTSVPVLLETFTFLDRNTVRDVALAWRDSLSQVADLGVLTVSPADLEEAWPYFQRRELHKLSAVDATSFVLMSHEKIRTAFTFDHHFAMAGFRLVG